MTNEVICNICNTHFETITSSHLNKHDLILKEYLGLYPHAVLVCDNIKRKKSISMIGHSVSEDTKRKISLANKGKKLTEEHRKKISLIQKGIKRSEEFKQKLRDYYRIYGHPFKGKKHSDETKIAISLKCKERIPWNRGKPCPEDVKEKISKKLKGIKLSLATRNKMSISGKGRKMSLEAREKMRGRKVSLETREKISKAQRGKVLSNETLKKISDSLNNTPNKFERWAIDLFERSQLPLKFVGDFKNPEFFIAGKVPDFVATNSRKILVEIYNDYHKTKDYGSVENFRKERSNVFSKYGWKTLFFDYKELKNNPNKCVSELKRELIE